MRVGKTVAIVLFLFVATIISCVCFAEEEISGTVIYVYRDSYLMDYETGGTVKTKAGTLVTPGDIITTEEKATAVLDFNEDLIKLDSNTTMKLIAFDGGEKGEGNVTIFLLLGMLYVKVEERINDSLFTVATAGSVIESKGAEFTVESMMNDVTKEDAEAAEILEVAGEYSEVNEETRMFAVDVVTTVYSGSVSSGIIDAGTNGTLSPVSIGEGEFLENHFSHVVFGFGDIPVE